LRRAFALESIAAGIDIGTVAAIMGAAIMGDDSKMLLDHYQHVAEKQKIAAAEALPEIPNYGKKLRQVQTSDSAC
jgi:hypothetical protein